MSGEASNPHHGKLKPLRPEPQPTGCDCVSLFHFFLQMLTSPVKEVPCLGFPGLEPSVPIKQQGGPELSNSRWRTPASGGVRELRESTGPQGPGLPRSS